MAKVDLHIHTNLSDGLLTPEEVVIKAKQNGCETISITDHELCNSYEDLSKKYNIDIVTGIEFNTSVTNMHLLGYGITDVDRISRTMDSLREVNEIVCMDVIKALSDDGFDVSPEQIKEYLDSINLDSQTLDKRKLVKYLMYKGYSNSVIGTYRELIGQGQKYYIESIKMTPIEIMEQVIICGGVTVLAHPNTITTDEQILSDHIKELLNHGLYGIEVKNTKMKTNNTEMLKEMARHYGLVPTYGSDFHDPSHDDIGIDVDYEIDSNICERLLLRR